MICSVYALPRLLLLLLVSLVSTVFEGSAGNYRVSDGLMVELKLRSVRLMFTFVSCLTL